MNSNEVNSKVYIVNGPNLNLLGRREKAIYGTESMETVVLRIQRKHPDLHIIYRQSNHEGDLIDWLQAADAPVVLNAAGYTHTSISIRDAVAYLSEQGIPVVEVHISDIYAREDFRHNSLLTDVCHKSIIGQGTIGYDEAVDYIIGL